MARATASIKLPDRYRVIRHIANGGMASVWEAHDEALDRAVAVKVLAGHLSEDDTSRRRFQREARMAAGLSSHPNVATIYDVGALDGKSYIVMELLPGGSVADRIKSGQEIDDDTSLRWLREAGAALDAAHDAGIVHRDVKPANMLLDARGRLALGDFGIARLGLEDQITQTGQVLGTAAYISPEQAMGERATAASDRYALAVVAFQLLTGSKPFPGDNFAAQARAHVEDEPPAASAVDDSLPPAVDGVLARGMAKEPADRWPSAGAFVSALDEALDEGAPAGTTRVLPVTAAAPGRVAPPPPRDPGPPARDGGGGRSGRSAGPLIALVAAVLLIAAAALLLTRGGDDGDKGRNAADSTATPDATAKPEKTAKPDKTNTPEPTPEETATPEPTPEATATATPEPANNGNGQGNGNGRLGNDPTALQLEAYNRNQAGDAAGALPYAEKAVKLCQGSTEVSPCAYALFEYARALRGTGDAATAVQVLEERLQRFPDDQRATVEQELKSARQEAGQG